MTTWQFSLRNLLTTVLLVAVLLGALPWTFAAWQIIVTDSAGMFAAGALVVGTASLTTYGISQRV